MHREELLTRAARLACAVRAAAGEERGSALLLALTLVMVMTLLGVALFEMGTIEAGLARGDAADIQAFYCAEAEAARVYALYAPEQDETASLTAVGSGPTALSLPTGVYIAQATGSIDGGRLTVKATCTMPNGRTRTVERGATRDYLNPVFTYALGAGGYNRASGSQDLFADLGVGGDGAPVRVGGPIVGGADTLGGDIYVAGNVALRGEGTVTGYGTDTPPAITVAPGRTVTSTSTRFNPLAAGATATGLISPMPVLSNSDGTGTVDRIKAAVTNPDGTQRMTASFQGATVYNLGEIFRQLGATSEGNRERNLARPSGCTFGRPTDDRKCQVWQDLAVLGPRQICGNPTGTCVTDVQGPTDAPSYFFMGLPRTSSLLPQGTSFADIYAAVVTASPELQQLGFTTQYISLGTRLNVLLGSNPDGEGSVDRLVDFTVGIDPATGKGVRREPGIFYVDGYWRTDGASGGFAYNGRATIAAARSAILSDNVLYLGSLANVNKDPPASCAGGADDRTGCGAADVVAVMAVEDIWTGDPTGTVHQVAGILLAGHDVNLMQYSLPADCCRGTSNPLTFNGALIGLRSAALARDWADPTPGREAQTCNTALPPCRPVTFVATDSTCGAAGCWQFLKRDGNGMLTPDSSLRSFAGCITTQALPLVPSSCPAGARRVTHFQLVVNYDARLQTHPDLAPPGLPTGGGTAYTELQPMLWRDCGSDRSCGPSH